MSESLKIGDYIALHATEVDGFVFCQDSGSQNGILGVKPDPDIQHPNLPNPFVAVFQVCIAHRYKFSKKRRKILEQLKSSPKDVVLRSKLSQTEKSAKAEDEGNRSEMRRLTGKRVVYGQVVQLKHIFTDKFIHISTTNTSFTSSSDMLVEILPFNSKNAHLRIMPRFKVKSEGDEIHYDDQIVFESMKSIGQYMHVSAGLAGPKAGASFDRHEVNLSVRQTGYTLFHFSRGELEERIQGGSMIRLFHKEVEAYVCAEGQFHSDIVENVHLRVREMIPSIPKTMAPSTSAITYWQIELEEGILLGNVITWESQVKLRHMVTRKYLSVAADTKKLVLIENGSDPMTVFKISPVIETEMEVAYETYARFEHVVTGMWLHALPDLYEKNHSSDDNSNSMTKLRWDKAILHQIGLSSDMQYDDAFTLQQVTPTLAEQFNFAAGVVPLFQKLLADKKNGVSLTYQQATRVIITLRELSDFMLVHGEPNKDRQKLLRNLMIVELMVDLLHLPIANMPDQGFMTNIFGGAYDALLGYLLGDSRKNELYIAKQMDFFFSQISLPGELGIWSASMVTELIRDNRQIVDRIPKTHIDAFVELLFKNRNYRYLDMLNVLCVCDGVSLPENQNYITKKWLVESKQKSNAICCFLTETGESLNNSKRTNKYDVSRTYVSIDGGRQWQALDEFATTANSLDVKFLVHQLELFEKLSTGRNEYVNEIITESLCYLTWEEAFMCLKDERLPSDLRAKYCSLIISLFIDIGDNFSVLNRVKLTFIYENIGVSRKRTDRAKSIVSGVASARFFPALREWVEKFLDNTKDMTASEKPYNLLVRQVLRMVYYLATFGYYQGDDVAALMMPMLSLMDGTNDKPLPTHDLEALSAEESKKLVEEYSTTGRFLPSEVNKAVVDAKLMAMDVLEIIFNLRFNNRLEKFINIFKQMDYAIKGLPNGNYKELAPLLREDFDIHDDPKVTSKARAYLANMMEETAFLKDKGVRMKTILLDLSRYQYDAMITKTMQLLTRYFSAHDLLFERAVQAQVVINKESVEMFVILSQKLPVLRRLANAKMSPEQIKTMSEILDTLIGYCVIDPITEESHKMNQDILYNQGIIADIFDLLGQKIDIKLLDQYEGLRNVIRKAFNFLKVMARDNPVVQQRLFDRLTELLVVRGAENEMAEALTEVFVSHKTACIAIPTKYLQSLVSAVMNYGRTVPRLLTLLENIIKVKKYNIPLKRNQAAVIKGFIQHNRKFTELRNEKASVLKKGTETELHYFVNLVDLLATCAEGENKFIESICQTIFSVDELLDILIDNSLYSCHKKPILRFLLWVYINTGDDSSAAGSTINEDMRLWGFLRALISEIKGVIKHLKSSTNDAKSFVSTSPTSVCKEPNHHWTVFYIFEAVVPFLDIFYKNYYSKDSSMTEQHNLTNDLGKVLIEFTELVSHYITDPIRSKQLIKTVTTILQMSSLGKKDIEHFQSRFASGLYNQEMLSDSRRKYQEIYKGEEEINASLNIFAVMMKKCYGGENTALAQLGFSNDRKYIDNEDESSPEFLPLGEDFQTLVECFTKKDIKETKVVEEMAEKLIDCVWILDHTSFTNEKAKLEASRLTVVCLKLLRAFIHNEERRLPSDWEDNLKSNEKILLQIKSVQCSLNKLSAIKKVVPLLTKGSNEAVKETLSFLVSLLYNGNLEVQNEFMNYFLSTREETFFFSIKNHMQISLMATKEKKSLISQHETKIAEAVGQMKHLKKMLLDREATKGSRLGSTAMLSSKMSLKQLYSSTTSLRKDLGTPKKSLMDNGYLDNKIHPKVLTEKKEVATPTSINIHVEEEPEIDNALLEALSANDDGHIELVLKLLGLMCDGQHNEIQHYLRDQPDNIKSINLIAEIITFLQVIYSNINATNIDLVQELFQTLLEVSAGNFHNQIVCFEHKIIDYVNHIIRLFSFSSCELPEVLDLKKTVSELIVALIEENNPEIAANVEEIKESIDHVAILENVFTYYKLYNLENAELEEFEKDLEIEDAKSCKEQILDVGFRYFHILLRLRDLPGTNVTLEKLSESFDEKELLKNCWDYFQEHTMSIEVLKDNNLQKIHFKVKSVDVLREDVKEQLKWNVDRTSPSNKQRDFVDWSADIINDIKYQTKIMANPLARFLVKHENLWHKLVIMVTLILNLVMLLSFTANSNDVFTTKPLYPTWYPYFLYTFGGIHVVLSFILVLAYFISNRPTLPSWSDIINDIKGLFGFETTQKAAHENKLEVKFFTAQTIYYLIFFALSFSALFFDGYFYCVHLFHIVPRSQMLMRVLQAVTLNGKSLLLVAVLGVLIIWIYAVAGFAFVRYAFIDDDGLYCNTMLQCFVTSLRFGIIEGIQNYVGIPAKYASFNHYTVRMLYDVTFFIIFVTILMNIIFGIIVDTFSELRNIKWETDQDMKNFCFICSRSNYDFEHYGQGFEHHVKKEHNMWSYLFYFIRLEETRSNDYTALDLYIGNMMEKENYDFFPTNRALCLQDDNDEVDTKLEMLQLKVDKLLTRQEEMEIAQLRQQKHDKNVEFKRQHRITYRPHSASRPHSGVKFLKDPSFVRQKSIMKSS